MMEMLLGPSSPRGLDPWGERMLAPDEVAAVVRLHKLGWGTKRIAGAFGCSRNTVKRYLAAGGWLAMRAPRRKRRLDGLEGWLAERFRRHRDSRDVVRQDLLREHGVTVSLRTVERAVVLLRLALQAEARACLRFETAGQAAADRLWRDHGCDRRREGAGAPVCGDAGLLTTAVCPGLPA